MWPSAVNRKMAAHGTNKTDLPGGAFKLEPFGRTIHLTFFDRHQFSQGFNPRFDFRRQNRIPGMHS